MAQSSWSGPIYSANGFFEGTPLDIARAKRIIAGNYNATTGALESFALPNGTSQPVGSTTATIDLQASVVVDGTTDNTAVIQAGLNAAAALNPDTDSYQRRNASVVLPQGRISCGPITIPDGVMLEGRGARLLARSAGYQVTMSNVSGIRDIILDANGIANCEGINVPATKYDNLIEFVFFWNHFGRAIVDQGLATYMDRINVQNALLGYVNVASTPYTGAIELRGNDAWVTRSASATANGFAGPITAHGKGCALAIFNPNNMVTNFIAQVSDIGIYIGSGATETTMLGCRAELNWAHGVVVEGGSGMITDLRCLRNNRSNGGYGGFLQNGGAEFLVRGLFIKGQDAPPYEAFGLQVVSFSNFPTTTYYDPYIRDCVTPVIETNGGQTTVVISRTGKPASISGATPSLIPNGVLQQNYEMNNASPTTVTNFTGGVHGQQILVRGDGQSTVQHGTNIFTTTGANKLLANGTYYRFVRRTNNTWAEF